MTQLDRFLSGHFASHHSPTRERRELRFAVNTGTIPTPEEQAEINKTQAEGVAGEALPKAPATAEQKEGADPNIKPTVDANVDATRDSTKAVLTAEEKEDDPNKPTAQKAMTAANALKFEIDRIKSLYLSIIAMAPGSEWATEAQHAIDALSQYSVPLNELTQILENMEAWESGEADPGTCRAILDQAGIQNRDHHIDAVLFEKGVSESGWSSADRMKKMDCVREISKRLGFPGTLEAITTELLQLKDKFEGGKKKVNEILEKFHEKGRVETPSKRIGSWFGIELYSIGELLEVGQKVIKAYSDAWGERKTRRVAEATSKVATLVPRWPFGDSVKNDLYRDADNALASPDEDELKYLQTNRLHFSDLFGDGGRMDEMFKRPSTTKKALAILDYAAERGWLYDLRKNDRGHNSPRRIFHYNRVAVII
jgi:hypothetical protein